MRWMILIWLLLAKPILAQSSLGFSRNARTNENVISFLLEKTLAHACLTLFELSDHVPCNPAYTPLTQTPGLAISALFSNGYATLQKTQRLMSGRIDGDLLQDLFSQDHVLQAEGVLQVYFKSRWFAAAYTPFAVRYYSATRNEANPDVELIAVGEESFMVQSGIRLLDQLYVGARLRSVTRNLIRKRFKLLDAVTDAQILKPETQRLIFVEPAGSYVVNLPGWPTIVLSAMLENLGAVEGGDQASVPISPRFAIGASHPVGWGRLESVFEYRALSPESDTIERLHFGAVYHFGILSAAAGIDYDGISAGINYDFQSLNTGISYSTNQVPWRSRDFYFQTVYVQAGWRM